MGYRERIESGETQVTIWVPQELWARVRERAAAVRVPMERWVTEFLRATVVKQERMSREELTKQAAALRTKDGPGVLEGQAETHTGGSDASGPSGSTAVPVRLGQGPLNPMIGELNAVTREAVFNPPVVSRQDPSQPMQAPIQMPVADPWSALCARGSCGHSKRLHIHKGAMARCEKCQCPGFVEGEA